MGEFVTITATSRYIYVSRADGSLLSRNLTIEDAIEAAVNAGPGDYRITYPDRTVKVYGTLPASPVPTTPTALTLEEATAGYVMLSWTDDGSGTSWTVYRDGVPLGNVAVAYYTDSTVVPSTGYSYQVQATNSSGSSALSDALAVTTSANSLPAWDLSDQSGTIGTAYSLNLNTVCSDADNHTRAFTLTSGSVPGLSLNSPNYAGTPTTAGAYPLTFQANDGYGTSDVSITFTVADPDVTAPTVPTGVSASANGSTVTVTWTASTDASSVATYRVYRDGVFRAVSAASPYVESGVPVASYVYTVSAVDASANANESAQSSSAPVTVVPQTPDTPINFTAVSDGATTINLSWAAGPNGAAPDDYDIDFSATGANGPWTALTFVGTATTYSHTGRTAGVTYYYRVRAGLGVLESGYAADSETAGLPYPAQPSGPPWLHGPGQVGTYSLTDPASGLYKWQQFVGHNADIVVAWSALSNNNSSTWAEIEGTTSGTFGGTGANFKSAVQNLPPTRPIVHCCAAMPGNLGDQLSNYHLQNPAAWDAIAEGRYNDHYIAMGDNMRAFMATYGRLPSSIAIRLGWEMTGDWYPWSMPNNIVGFKAGWKVIVDILRDRMPGVKIDLSIHRRRPGYTNTGASNYTVTAADGRKGYDLSQWIPVADSYDFFACSQHDWSKIISGYNGGVAVSTVDEYTWNYLHLSPPVSQSETGLQEACDWARARGKGFGISEWGIQYVSDGNLPASVHPSFFLTKIFNFLYANRDITWWDGYLVNSSTNMANRTGVTYTYGGQTFNAATTYKTLWT